MSKVNCLECEHWKEMFGCEFQFRWAANAGGRGVNCKEDVWFCQDYSQKAPEYPDYED